MSVCEYLNLSLHSMLGFQGLYVFIARLQIPQEKHPFAFFILLSFDSVSLRVPII